MAAGLLVLVRLDEGGIDVAESLSEAEVGVIVVRASVEDAGGSFP